jgi:hypothetical protein
MCGTGSNIFFRAPVDGRQQANRSARFERSCRSLTYTCTPTAFFLANELYGALSGEHLATASPGRDPVSVAESILALTSGDLTVNTFAERFPHSSTTLATRETQWDDGARNLPRLYHAWTEWRPDSLAASTENSLGRKDIQAVLEYLRDR